MESELNKGEKGHRARANEGRNERGCTDLGKSEGKRGKRKRERKTEGSAQRWTVGDSKKDGQSCFLSAE